MSDSAPDGATPLEEEEAADLIPQHIRTRDELNVWEQENILIAARWAQRVRKSMLDEAQVRTLHRRMFNKTWKWAGHFRTSDKNIGVAWPHIAVELRSLLDDGQFWIENEVFSTDEIALRLHHRLVLIHPFSNGNGRHARLWSDTILRHNGRPPFTWKSGNLESSGGERKRYINALRAADQNDYSLLKTLLLDGRSER